ncbi:hypothetical protein T484DRAFT_1921772, partial [Baffinella frigidus]
ISRNAGSPVLGKRVGSSADGAQLRQAPIPVAVQRPRGSDAWGYVGPRFQPRSRRRICSAAQRAERAPDGQQRGAHRRHRGFPAEDAPAELSPRRQALHTCNAARSVPVPRAVAPPPLPHRPPRQRRAPPHERRGACAARGAGDGGGTAEQRGGGRRADELGACGGRCGRAL